MNTQANPAQVRFADAYHTLKSNAELLENEQEIDIDNLMAVVESSIHAYKICQARIDAIEATLKNSFDALENDKAAEH